MTADTVVTHAPTNIRDVVSQLGFWAGLIILVPRLVGFFFQARFKPKVKRAGSTGPNNAFSYVSD